MAEEMKRNSFDREQPQGVTNVTLELIYDEEKLKTGWERIYTVVSIHSLLGALKFRFGTGDKSKQKWHEEEPAPVAGVYYNTEREYHARQEHLGVVGVFGACPSGIITVIWHGYDKRIRER